MPLWFAALLGLVQGLSEFLPISSTAHLRLIPALLGRPDPGAAFTAVIQLGTLIAVIVYFARELAKMARAVVVDRAAKEARLAWLIILGTLPIGIAGVAAKPFITGDARSLWVVAVALIVVAIVMWFTDREARQDRTIASLGLVDAVIIGTAQACALIPGVSRSGATIVAALLVGLSRADGARFSFLLSIPAIAAAGLFEAPDAFRELGSSALGPLAVATVVAGVSGYASIAWLISFLATRTLAGLVIYRLAVGLLILGLLTTGVLTAR